MKDVISLTIVLSMLCLAGESPAQGNGKGLAAKPVKDMDKAPVAMAVEDETPAAESLPALEFKITKIYSRGTEYARLTSANIDGEFIGITVPADWQMQASESGRDLIVYLDSAHRNWVKFEFLTKQFPEFNGEVVWASFDELLKGANPVYFTEYVLGRPILGFTSSTGSVNNLQQKRVQLIPLKKGTLLVSTIAYGNEGKKVFSKMKQLVSSLQFTQEEKDLKHEEPIFED